MPWDAASGADGLFLDITGCAHLFGGEARLLADLDRRLTAFGLVARLAIADTAGAAWAMARYGRERLSIVPPGAEADALRALPLAGLRLSSETLSLLKRLGFRSIGQVLNKPRAPFAARFEELLLRLDQALGCVPEPFTPIVAPPAYRVQAAFLEPITASAHVLEAAIRLLDQLAVQLAHDAVGARVLRLLLFRVDGEVQSLDLGLAAPSRDAAHIARLIALRLDGLADDLDADFGFEAAAVHVLTAEPLAERQGDLTMDEAAPPPDALPQLIDRLRQRLGQRAVYALQPYQSHLPERAVVPSPLVGEGQGGGDGRTIAVRVPPTPNPSPQGGGESKPRSGQWVNDAVAAPRPLLLLPRPEPAEVVALIPEGPPRQFRWRGVLHQVAEAQGPERIAPEWWRRTGEDERDYYMVEDTAGRRFWLYRAGIYGRSETTPTWFMHGVFA
jgi:protein ImuB